MVPENKMEEVVLKRGPDKLKEWMKIFESKGFRVEFSEPSTGDINYFAKVWGYLEKPDPSPSFSAAPNYTR
jgi:hypothetical protein